MKSINNIFLKNLCALILVFAPLAALAVTEKEMEEARTIATKSYLRYANDGSGYLDDLAPKTMAELEAQLKPKEKENIKAFKAIPVPTDYKNWDKEKLVEFWAVTAFQNKGLLEKGRGGRIRTRSLINKMNIGAPESTPAAPPASPASNGTNDTKAASAPNNPADSLASTALPDLTADEAMLAADQTPENDLNTDKAYNYTWVYIMVLCILVGVVLALVLYAANVMKKNGKEASGGYRISEEDAEKLERLESLMADKEVEIAMLKKKLDSSYKENADLKSKIESLSSRIESMKKSQTSQPSMESRPANTEMRPTTAAKGPIRSIYLGRANAKGIFVRADRNLNVGNSVFVLDTADGYSGTFKVADSPAAWSLALSNPKEYLATACTGLDLNDISSYSRIVTLTPGTAVFEGGCWKVIRKAKIKGYE